MGGIQSNCEDEPVICSYCYKEVTKGDSHSKEVDDGVLSEKKYILHFCSKTCEAMYHLTHRRSAFFV